MKIENFKFLDDLWTLRLKDRSLLLAPGVEPLVIVGRDYPVSFTCDGKPRKITVPKGLLTDLTSVPRYARWLVSKVGRHLEAAIIHDWLYGYHPEEGLAPGIWNRKLADAIFLAGMKAANVPRLRMWAIYRAVRLGGAKSYREGENQVVVIDS